jgi:hypothetical protein
MLPTVVRAVLLVTLVLGFAGPAAAQSSTKIEGILNDYSDVTNTGAGSWHIAGEWSLVLKGNSGRGDFIASLTMARTPSGGSQHTHHVQLLDGTVTTITNGYTISGAAAITGSGAPAGFTGSPITVTITGDPAAVPVANMTLTFGGGAASHFDAAPLNGVVVYRLP